MYILDMCNCTECWYVDDCEDQYCNLKEIELEDIELSKGLEIRGYD